MKIIKKQLIASFFFLFVSTQLAAFTNATSYFTANNYVMYHKPPIDTRLLLGGFFEMGSTRSSRNLTGSKVGLFQQYNNSESIINMLNNPIGLAAAEGAANVIPVGAAFGATKDDGSRGNVKLDGKYYETDFAFNAHWSFLQLGSWGNFGLGAYIPWTVYKIDSVTQTDLTQDIFPSDAVLSSFIANLDNNLKKYGGLQLGKSYNNQGIGDCIVDFDWRKQVDNLEHHFKRIDFYIGAGLLIPGQLLKDEDQVLSYAHGTDGSFGIPIKLGFWVDGKKWVYAGLDAQLLYVLSSKKNRRMKTDPNQTELFLLNKGNSRKEYGVTWQAHTWLMVTDFYEGVFAKLSYQFIRHESDKLYTEDVNFDNVIINSARTLQGWSGQDVVIQLGYNVAKDDPKMPFVPVGSLFYKKPIAGKAIINSDTYGAMLQISF